MTFKELNFHAEVLEGIKNAGFENCMPVQESVLPTSLCGNDVMVQSKTGSGKTAVFVLTFLERFVCALEEEHRKKALVIAPTRELASQIASDAKVLCSGIKDFRVGCFYGGVRYEGQRKTLLQGCDIYVATPGRLLDFMNNGEFDASEIDVFVIDEADRMFDMGFYPDICRIFRRLKPRGQRQTMLFSATLEQKVREMAWEFMNNPEVFELEPESITVDKISQCLYHVAKSEKFGLFLQLLKAENPESALVFTNSRSMTMEVASRLKFNGYNAEFISGDLSQSAREKALDDIKSGKIQILVATDVAARGLQIDDLPLVVNYDLPEDYENYVHRIGRTARAGKSGKAISLADEEFVYGLEAIENYIKMKIPVIWPDNLPEVKDLSLGKKWRVPVAKTSSRGSSRGTSRASSTGIKTRAQSGLKSQKRSVADLSDEKLASMSQKQVMDYYRKQFGLDDGKSSATEDKKSQGQKTSGKKPVVSKSDNLKTAVTGSQEKKKAEKKGFFRHFVEFFGKKK